MNKKNIPNKTKKAIINPIDHLPKFVFGRKWIFIAVCTFNLPKFIFSVKKKIQFRQKIKKPAQSPQCRMLAGGLASVRDPCDSQMLGDCLRDNPFQLIYTGAVRIHVECQNKVCHGQMRLAFSFQVQCFHKVFSFNHGEGGYFAFRTKDQKKFTHRCPPAGLRSLPIRKKSDILL